MGIAQGRLQILMPHPLLHRPRINARHEGMRAFFVYPPEIFPNDEAANKLLYLAVQNIAEKWSMPIRDRKAALNQFAIRFEDRVPLI